MSDANRRATPFSSTHRSTPSPVPLMSISSLSSSSSSAAARSQLHRLSNSSTNSILGGVTKTKVAKNHTSSTTANNKRSANKTKNKWSCSICLGSVRFPPPSQPHDTSADVSTLQKTTNCTTDIISRLVDVSEEEKVSINKSLESITVNCSLQDCSFPRYHLSCLNIPIGSQIFRYAIRSSRGAKIVNESKNINPNACCSSNATETIQTPKHDILERIHSAAEGVVQNFLTIQDSFATASSKSTVDPSLCHSFICPNCDVEGASRYLLEYFEQFHSMKKVFYGKFLNGTVAKNATEHPGRLESVEECVESRTGTPFLQFLVDRHRKEYAQLNENPGKSENKQATKRIPRDVKSSELRLHHMSRVLDYLCKQQNQVDSVSATDGSNDQCKRQDSGFDEFELDPSYIVGRPLRLFNPVDNSYHTGRIIDFRLNAPHKVDKANSGAKSPSRRKKRERDRSHKNNVNHLLDEDICNTLYLVRFRNGVEGRKAAIHQWIYLEEHAISVGGEVCWAKVGDDLEHGDGMTKKQKIEIAHRKTNAKTNVQTNARDANSGRVSGDEQPNSKECWSLYRPVQIVFRSALEMIPAKDLNPLLSCLHSSQCKKSDVPVKGDKMLNKFHGLTVLAMGFGQSFQHVRLPLGDSGNVGASISKKKIVGKVATKNAKKNVNTASITKSDAPNTESDPVYRPPLFPLVTSTPKWLDQILHRARLYDHGLALGVAMAFMAKEEERRVRTRRQLSVTYLSSQEGNESDDATMIS